MPIIQYHSFTVRNEILAHCEKLNRLQVEATPSKHKHTYSSALHCYFLMKLLTPIIIVYNLVCDSFARNIFSAELSFKKLSITRACTAHCVLIAICYILEITRQKCVKHTYLQINIRIISFYAMFVFYNSG